MVLPSIDMDLPLFGPLFLCTAFEYKYFSICLPWGLYTNLYMALVLAYWMPLSTFLSLPDTPSGDWSCCKLSTMNSRSSRSVAAFMHWIFEYFLFAYAL